MPSRSRRFLRSVAVITASKIGRWSSNVKGGIQMSDATCTTPVQDQVTAIDVDWINICPADSLIRYSLRETWASGKMTIRNGSVSNATAFASCLGSFCQAAPKRKLLTWLVSNGYET